MKKVLCFGDSNVFGFNPENATRFGKEIRWTGKLQFLAGNDYKIIEAGCNNRTAFCINPAGELQTGIKILPKILHNDIDIVILSVGTNDLQFAYKTRVDDFYQGVANLLDVIKNRLPNGKIILLSPSVIGDGIFNGFFRELFDETSIQKSKELSVIYQKIANKYNCEYLDLEQIVKVSDVDGLHYDEEAHQIIAEILWSKIAEL